MPTPSQSRPTRSWPLIASGACFLAVGIPYWVVPYSKGSLPNDLIGPGLLLVAVASLTLRVAGMAGKRRITVVVGGAVPAAVVARIVVEGLKDPSSHNLAPFEVIIALLVGMPTALAGAIVGSVIAYLLGRRTPGEGNGRA